MTLPFTRLRRIRDEQVARFVLWAEDFKHRADAGEFGKWPWQKGYKDVGLWGQRRKDDDER